MNSTFCDVCKKKIDDPITDRTFYYIEKFGVCQPCKDSLDFHIRASIRSKDPFAIDWYRKFVVDSLDKSVQKGKI